MSNETARTQHESIHAGNTYICMYVRTYLHIHVHTPIYMHIFLSIRHTCPLKQHTRNTRASMRVPCLHMYVYFYVCLFIHQNTWTYSSCVPWNSTNTHEIMHAGAMYTHTRVRLRNVRSYIKIHEHTTRMSLETALRKLKTRESRIDVDFSRDSSVCGTWSNTREHPRECRICMQEYIFTCIRTYIYVYTYIHL